MYFLQQISIENYNWLKDYIIPLFIGLMSTFSVYHIFKKQSLLSKKIDDEKKKENLRDKLIYFSALITSIIEFSKFQNINIQKAIEKLENDNTALPTLECHTPNQLRRIAETTSFEGYLAAYITKYNKNRKESIKEFNSIIDSVDFLYSITEQIVKNWLIKHDSIDADMLQLYNLFIKTNECVEELFIYYISNDAIKADELLTLRSKYNIEFKKGTNLVSIRDEFFFKPISDFLLKYTKQDNFEIYKKVMQLVSEAINLFEYIRNSNSATIVLLQEDSSEISSAISDLENVSKKILADYKSA